MFPTRLTVAALTAVAGLLLCGCGGPNDPVTVKGVITLDGVGVAGATVSFLPERDDGRPANALTGADGSFTLTTFKKGDGALRGAYRVAVTKLEPKLPDGPRWTEYWDDEHDKKKKPVQYYGMVHASAIKPSKSLLPDVYGDAATTPLKCIVPANAKLTLELKTKR
jgi:hypothetical protein